MSDLFSDEQHDAFKQLVAVQCSDGEIQKQAVQHWPRDQLELVNEQDGQTDEHVTQDGGHSGLTDTHDPGVRQC